MTAADRQAKQRAELDAWLASLSPKDRRELAPSVREALRGPVKVREPEPGRDREPSELAAIAAELREAREGDDR